MKKVAILSLALVVVLSLSAKKAEAADYGRWLYLQYILNFDAVEQQHSLTTGHAVSDVNQPAVPHKTDPLARIKVSPDKVDYPKFIRKSPDRVDPNARIKAFDRTNYNWRLKEFK